MVKAIHCLWAKAIHYFGLNVMHCLEAEPVTFENLSFIENADNTPIEWR